MPPRVYVFRDQSKFGIIPLIMKCLPYIVNQWKEESARVRVIRVVKMAFAMMELVMMVAFGTFVAANRVGKAKHVIQKVS